MSRRALKNIDFQIRNQGRGSKQRKSTREGFFWGLRKFAGLFWKSFPCERSYKTPRNTKKKQRITPLHQDPKQQELRILLGVKAICRVFLEILPLSKSKEIP